VKHIAPSARLFVAEPSGRYVPAPDGAVIRAAAEAVTRALHRGPSFSSPAAARKLLPALLGPLQHEEFCIAHLDAQARLIDFERLFRGTVDGASVHPREVVRSAIAHNSVSIVLVHNHPSGSPEPSEADKIITIRIRQALQLVDIRVLDHFLVAGGELVSLTDRGII
jgi:DNA repair protein RadC